MDPHELRLVHPAVGEGALEHPYVASPCPTEIQARKLFTVEVGPGADRRDCHAPTVAEILRSDATRRAVVC